VPEAIVSPKDAAWPLLGAGFTGVSLDGPTEGAGPQRLSLDERRAELEAENAPLRRLLEGLPPNRQLIQAMGRNI
jgi:hypothetical protein